MDIRKLLAELIGTFVFMSIGYLSVGAFHATNDPGAPGLLVVPFAFGFGLLAAIFAFGHISGGHYNPAVTVAMILDKRTTPVDGIGYIVAQIVGAIGAAVLVMIAVSQQAITDGETMPGGGVTDIGAFIIETAMAAGFLVVILAATKRAPALAALAIPLSLVAIHFASATLSGASVNPARSIGSAVVGGGDGLSVLWIYLTAPILGGVIGWAVWRFTDGGREADAA